MRALRERKKFGLSSQVRTLQVEAERVCICGNEDFNPSK